MIKNNTIIKFLKEYESGLNWTCIDTLVGLFFIFLVDDNGDETLIGIREQEHRKGDSTYSFISEEYRSLVIEKLIEMIEPEPDEHTQKHIFTLQYKAFK